MHRRGVWREFASSGHMALRMIVATREAGSRTRRNAAYDLQGLVKSNVEQRPRTVWAPCHYYYYHHFFL